MLLTLKPIFVVVNCDEEKINDTFSFPDNVESVNISIKTEQEIQQLNEQEKKDFLQLLGLKESPSNRLIKFAYNFGGLISFITACPKEIHSWTIKRGTTAYDAADTIHSDIKKGFIRAEVIHFDNLKLAGSEAEAKKMGFYSLKGKDYIVNDGDVIYFRFNV